MHTHMHAHTCMHTHTHTHTHCGSTHKTSGLEWNMFRLNANLVYCGVSKVKWILCKKIYWYVKKKKSLKATVCHLSRTQSSSCIFCFWLRRQCRFALRLLSAVPPSPYPHLPPQLCFRPICLTNFLIYFFSFPCPSQKLISIPISKLFSCYWLLTNQSSKGRILHWFALTLGNLFVPSPFPSRFSQTKN